MKYEGPKSYQSDNMANIKVLADKQTDGRAQNYVPPIYRCGGGGLKKKRASNDHELSK